MCCTRYLMLLSLVVATTAQINVVPDQALYTVDEGVSSFNICLSFTASPSDDAYTITYEVVTVPGSPQATDPSDYSVVGDMIEISENDTSPVCIRVDVTDDAIIEHDESFGINFSSDNATFTSDSINVTITDNDGDIMINVTDSIDVQEGNSSSLCANASTSNYEFSFTIVLSTINGTANASDVMLADTELQFNAGDTRQCFNITIVEDGVAEPLQYLDITYSVEGQPPDVVLSNNVTRINIPGQLVITTLATNVTEGASFCAVLNGPSDGTVTVTYTITGVTASDDDYSPTGSSILLFPSGASSVCFIDITDDSIVENTESFTVTFSDPVGAALSLSDVTVNIIDNDAASIGFSNTAITIAENFSLNLMTSINGNVAFDFTISASSRDGTAKAGSDFQAITDMEYNWTTTDTPTIGITLINDGIVEHDESFNVTITSPRNDIIVSDPIVTVTITDDDTSVIDTVPSVSVMESVGNRDICFDISHPIAPKVNEVNSTYSLNYIVSGTATEGDFSVSPSSLMIASLSTDDVCITVTIFDDSVMEDDETIILAWTLDSDVPARVMLQSPDTTITIVNDDVPTPTSTSAATPTSASTVAPILNTITLIGVVVGVVAAALLCLLVLCCVVLCVKVRFNRQGFYFTEEDKGDAPRMLRYSASLRSISSQTVLPMDTREKENEYMV